MGIVASKAGTRKKVGQRITHLSVAENASEIDNSSATYYLQEAEKKNEKQQKEIEIEKKTEEVYITYKEREIHLYLCKHGLIKVDPEIKQFRNLKILQICCNYLKDLPKEIGELTGLIVLFVARNKLESLPDTISGLVNLKEMNLSDNALTTLPDSIRMLPNLETLDISGNPISELPQAVTYISSLRSIIASRTNILYLPASILRLVFLSDIFFPVQENIFSLIPGFTTPDYQIKIMSSAIIIKTIDPVSLHDRALQRIVRTTRRVKKNTSAATLKTLMGVQACDICESPLFTPSVILFTKIVLCEKEVILRFNMCRDHLNGYCFIKSFLKMRLFREAEYKGDSVVPNISFMFDQQFYTKDQKHIVEKELPTIKNPEKETVHILLLEKLLKIKGYYHS